MIDHITLTPLPDDSGLSAELRGDFCLPSAWAKALESKDPSEVSEGSSSSVVAGAGFEPACASAYASAFGLKSLHWSDFRAPSAFKL